MTNERLEDGPEEEFEVDEPRSIFAALWFRAVIGVAALGVISAVAIPYVLDWTRLPIQETTALARPTPQRDATPPVTPPAPTAAGVTAGSSEPAQPPATSAATTPSAPTPPPTPAAPPAETTRPAAVASATVVPESKAAPKATGASRAGEPSPRTTTEPPPAVKSTPRATGEQGVGAYWVQVGAYRDAATAERVVARLRDLGYHVGDLPAPAPVAMVDTPPPPSSTEPAPASDTYDVVVSGAPAAKVTERLVNKGLVADVTASGVVVRPPMVLADAVALSREFAADGLRVQVRRTPPPASRTTPATAARSTASAPGDGLYRVRVGVYPDRVTALAAVKELSARGYEGFVARATP